MKKFLSILLVLAMMFSLSVTAFAQTPNNASTTTSNTEYTVDDIKALEPYISVENGNFVFDANSALSDNVPADLINGQTEYLDVLNTQANNGEISIANDLSITSTLSHSTMARAGHWDNCGGGRNTASTEYWWGYARYACDCQTRKMSADFDSCASVAAGVGLAGLYFGPVVSVPSGLLSSYWWLLSSRLDANNQGHGVYIEMTWAYVFDITPQ